MKENLDFFRTEYIKQRKLEKFVDSRPLVRPNVKKRQAVLSFVGLLFLIFAAVFFPLIAPIQSIWKGGLIAALLLTVFESYLRFCLILTVKCYQHYAKDETRKRCFCVPSCSQYAILSLKKIFPLILALLKIRKRLYVTCKGDYIIDFPTKKMGKEFEDNL